MATLQMYVKRGRAEIKWTAKMLKQSKKTFFAVGSEPTLHGFGFSKIF